MLVVLDSKVRVIHTHAHIQNNQNIYSTISAFFKIGIKCKTQRRVWENSHVIKFSGEDIISKLDGDSVQVLDNQQILSRWFTHWFIFWHFNTKLLLHFPHKLWKRKEVIIIIMMMIHFDHLISFPLFIWGARVESYHPINTYLVKRNGIYFASDSLHWYIEIGGKGKKRGP